MVTPKEITSVGVPLLDKFDLPPWCPFGTRSCDHLVQLNGYLICLSLPQFDIPTIGQSAGYSNVDPTHPLVGIDLEPDYRDSCDGGLGIVPTRFQPRTLKQQQWNDNNNEAIIENCELVLQRFKAIEQRKRQRRIMVLVCKQVRMVKRRKTKKTDSSIQRDDGESDSL